MLFRRQIDGGFLAQGFQLDDLILHQIMLFTYRFWAFETNRKIVKSEIEQLVDLKMHYLRIGVSYEGQTCFATHYGPFRPF